MNRLKQLLGQPEGPERPDDFFEISFGFESFYVSRRTAGEVERQLDHSPLPAWIVFRDLNGSRHRVQADKIKRVSESTQDQRTADRAFHRARRAEDKSDRTWDDDEYF